MYDLPGFYLVANPIRPYSIGYRTPGLRRAADSSLTIVMQHYPPADTSNSLPAPAAPFRPTRGYTSHGRRARRQLPLPPITKAIA